jgi:hypothetical protein
MKRIVILISLVFVFGITESEAQILKGLGKKIEKKIEERLDRKADKSVDKVLDKADSATDKPLDNILNKSSNKAEVNKLATEAPNIQTQQTASQAASSSHTQAPSEGLLVMSGNSCTDFIWFKSGAMMEFETKDDKGKLLNKSKMEISKVYDEGAMTVANAVASDDEGNSFDMQFKCAGDKMYMDFGSLIKQAMQQAGQEGADNASIQRALDNTEIGFSDGFMDFPKSMYPGQVLQDVSVSINSSPTPQFSIEMVSTLTDRKVVAKETVTTAAGSFDCMKISGVRMSSMKIMGMNKKMPSSIEHIWFAPGIGVIKQEDYDEKGKLGTSMQLTAYKL